MAKIQTKAFTNAKPIVLPDDASPELCTIDVEYGSTALAANDLIELCTIPRGYKVLDWYFVSPKIDSGTALAFSLGVENSGMTDLGTEVWGTAIGAAATGVPARNVLSACAQGDSTVDRVIALKCTTAATGYTGTGKVGQLVLTLQG